MGIDVSAEALRLAREWANKEGMAAHFSHMDITDTDFEDSSFDTVIMFTPSISCWKSPGERP